MDLTQRAAAAREADRYARQRERLATLRSIAHSNLASPLLLDTPALRQAVKAGLHFDAPRWEALLAEETARTLAWHAERRRQAARVLERYDRLQAATWERRRAKEAEARAAERAAAETQPLTLDGLLDALGMNPAFAEHLVQPYCTCEEETYDSGWYRCPHAEDLGLEAGR